MGKWMDKLVEFIWIDFSLPFGFVWTHLVFACPKGTYR